MYVIFLLVLQLHTSHTYVIPFLPHFHLKKEKIFLNVPPKNIRKGIRKILYQQHKTYTQKGDEILEIQQIVFFFLLRNLSKIVLNHFSCLYFMLLLLPFSFFITKSSGFSHFLLNDFFGVSFLFWGAFKHRFVNEIELVLWKCGLKSCWTGCAH